MPIQNTSTITLAFDVYGTLIDTQGVVQNLQGIIGKQANAFSQTWREKQLEYSFRRGLMRQYEEFSVCTAQALDYTCSFYKTTLDKAQKRMLLNSYGSLPAFSDAEQSLQTLKADGYPLYAFSNGSADAVEELLKSAGLRHYFLGVVSVNDIKTFKPNPAVYEYCLTQTHSKADNTWLISSNPFDVIGAISAGLNAAWIQRSADAIFDPWGIEPTLQLSSLQELASHL